MRIKNRPVLRSSLAFFALGAVCVFWTGLSDMAQHWPDLARAAAVLMVGPIVAVYRYADATSARSEAETALIPLFALYLAVCTVVPGTTPAAFIVPLNGLIYTVYGLAIFLLYGIAYEKVGIERPIDGSLGTADDQPTGAFTPGYRA